MNQQQLENKLEEMVKSEFIEPNELGLVRVECNNFIEKVNDIFGYNDGEPLDQDGLKFVLEMLELKWKLTNAIYEDDE